MSCSEHWKVAFSHLSFDDFAAHANTTAGAEDLAQCENIVPSTEPDWITEDVLAETSERVCVERSVLVQVDSSGVLDMTRSTTDLEETEAQQHFFMNRASDTRVLE